MRQYERVRVYFFRMHVIAFHERVGILSCIEDVVSPGCGSMRECKSVYSTNSGVFEMLVIAFGGDIVLR